MPSESNWLKRTKWLTQALILSCTLNICLLSTFVYQSIKEKKEALTLDLTAPFKAKKNSSALNSNSKLLEAYSILPYQKLLHCLENKDLVEEGLSKRDLALACLVAFHHFDLDKALGGIPLQRRELSLTHAKDHQVLHLCVFAGLADYQFAAILHYAHTEKWPLTSQGLFYEIKRSEIYRNNMKNRESDKEAPRNPSLERENIVRRQGSSEEKTCGGKQASSETDSSCYFGIQDPSLLAALYLTPEYVSAYTLFTRSGMSLSKESILSLLIEGSWSQVKELHSSQKASPDLSADKRRELLLSYLEHHSKQAASLLIQHDRDFVLKRLSDSQILTLLDLSSKEHIETFKLAKQLLLSPRTEPVWKKAAELLYIAAGEEMPSVYDHTLVRARFFPQEKQQLVQTTAPSASQEPTKRIHTVESGDSLWKIAHKYHVSIDAIVQANHLETERLRPGKKLEIPEKN